MSYILDALRRADAERERGHVPGLHTPPATPHRTGTPAASARWRPGLIAAAAVLLLLAGGLASRWLMDDKPVLPPAQAAPQVMAQAAPQAAPPVTAAAPAPSLDPGLVRLEPASAEPLVPTPAPRPQTAGRADTAAPPQPQTQPSQPQAAPKTAVVAAAPEPVWPKHSDLPEATRRELPLLRTGGSMYSSTPASRMLILDGQVFREGDKISPMLVLEQIRPNSAVLNYRGQRFTIAF